MGNRNHHKKLRAEARAMMQQTGESYQRVLSRLRSRKHHRLAPAPAARVELVTGAYFGLPVTLATFEILGEVSCVVMSAHHLRYPYPSSPLFGLPRRRTSN